jgi:hypothetical protein
MAARSAAGTGPRVVARLACAQAVTARQAVAVPSSAPSRPRVPAVTAAPEPP